MVDRRAVLGERERTSGNVPANMSAIAMSQRTLALARSRSTSRRRAARRARRPLTRSPLRSRRAPRPRPLLVAGHHRQRVRGRAGDHVPVAVADAARREPHGHLAGPGSARSTWTSSGRSISWRTAARTARLAAGGGTLAIVRIQAAVLREADSPSGSRTSSLRAPRRRGAGPDRRVRRLRERPPRRRRRDPGAAPLVLGHEASGVVVDTGPGVERAARRPRRARARSLVRRVRDPPARAAQLLRARRRMAATGRWPTARRGSPRAARRCTTSTRCRRSPSTPSCPSRSPSPSGRTCRSTSRRSSAARPDGLGSRDEDGGRRAGGERGVWGCGGVGLVAIQAARLAGAEPIVAVDTRRAGARGEGDRDRAARPTADTAAACATRRAAADYAFEAIGREETIREAWEALRPGGTAVVVGLPPKGSRHDRHLGLHQREDDQGCFLGSPGSTRTSHGSSTCTRRRPSPRRARHPAPPSRAACRLRAPAPGSSASSSSSEPSPRFRHDSAHHARDFRVTLESGWGERGAPKELSAPTRRRVRRAACRRRSSSSGMWQRIMWPGSTSARGAPRARRSPRASSGSVWKTQPEGGWRRSISPRRMRGRSSPSSAGTAERSASV